MKPWHYIVIFIFVFDLFSMLTTIGQVGVRPMQIKSVTFVR
jgi:hypothetical protein